MGLLNISIPNLSETPYVIQDVVLENKIYYFEYFWNIRHDKAYLSIYILSDNSRVYLIRNKLLTNRIILNKYMVGENNYLDGILSFWDNSGSLTYDYSQQNISTDFYIKYAYGDNDSVLI